MNDVILVEKPFPEFKKLVREAFKLCRNGSLLELSTSQLAQSSLVEPCFLADVPIIADVRGRAVQSVLRWATDKLRPTGVHSWTAVNWRSYNILHYFYTAGKRVTELAQRMAIAEQTLYQARTTALTAVSQILFQELHQPQDANGRKQYAIADWYHLYSPQDQLILRLTAAFHHSMPVKLIHNLAHLTGIDDVQTAIHRLVTANWLIRNERGTEVLVHPEVGAYLLTLLSPEERQNWHDAIGQYYLEQHEHWEAARHFRWAESPQQAAQILIEHKQNILNNMQIEELADLLAEFHPSELTPEQWAQLKIIAGDVARLMEDLDTALSEYQQALQATDVYTKAQAYYRRAKAFELKSLDESLAHYAYCIRLLEQTNHPYPLLAQVYIDRAWIFLEERQDLERAHADLQRVEQIIPADDRASWSDLHNAWSRLWAHQGDWDKAVEHGLQAWLAANEIQDVNKMINTAHNLGTTYARLGKFDDALTYLLNSRDLARRAGNRQMEALNSKTMGGCEFMLGQHQEAADHYRTALEVFTEMGNRNWQAHTYYDLAEVYGELRQVSEMRHSFQAGMALAQELGDDRLLQEFDELVNRYEELAQPEMPLNERQEAALAVIKQKLHITNRQYQRLNAVSPRQALRDLNELVTYGVLVKVGNGRSTRYTLATTLANNTSANTHTEN